LPKREKKHSIHWSIAKRKVGFICLLKGKKARDQEERLPAEQRLAELLLAEQQLVELLLAEQRLVELLLAEQRPVELLLAEQRLVELLLVGLLLVAAVGAVGVDAPDK